MFNKAMKRVNFVDYRTELVLKSSKKAKAEVREGVFACDGSLIGDYGLGISVGKLTSTSFEELQWFNFFLHVSLTDILTTLEGLGKDPMNQSVPTVALSDPDSQSSFPDTTLKVAKDFGVRPAFLFALLYPTRVARVVSLGVPHALFGPRKFHIELPKGFYINRWKEPGRAEVDFARLDAKTVVKNVYILFARSEIPIASEGQEIMDIVSQSTPLPSWFTDDDLSVYVALYEKSGFLNSLKVPYRSADEVYDIADQVIKNPMLVILGEKDYFLMFPGVEDFIKSGTINHFATSLEIEYVEPLILAFLKCGSFFLLPHLIVEYEKRRN
nr:bifunctional epoxide hydrolase 2-like [Tanacetum cinerariifolium]